MSTAEIQVDPSPPKRGQPCPIKCTGSKPITLTLTWDPDTEPRSVTITDDAGTAVNVPFGAWNVTIVDPTGKALARDLPTTA